MKNIFSQLLGSLFGSKNAWWIEVRTTEPACTYYFGPFDMEKEAELAKKGYLDDLEQEGSKVVAASILPLDEPPQQLTIYEDGMDGIAPDPKAAFSGRS